MTLKTLKDFDYRNDDYSLILIKELRQEAIKWIKDFKEKIRLHSHEDKSDPLYLKCISCRNMFVNIEWIKNFFNITEKELE